MPGQLKAEIAPLLAVFESINWQLVWVDTHLEHLAKSDETVERLCTPPSVGPVTAAAFSSIVDDVQRFQNAHQVEAYLGLTPSEWSSGEKQCKGHITKAGNNRMRRLLVQVAVSILRLRSPAHRGVAEMGQRHRGQAREEDRHRGLGAEDGRSALRDDARPDLLPPGGHARAVSAGRLNPIQSTATGKGDACTILPRIRKVGERES
jgi:transposase